jgi:organic radical activating enzyme
MGCLNSEGKFLHWFGNIHLSGPCNRSCYFCIGQHMMALDKYNNLSTFPLDNINNFVEECSARGIREVNLTGSNTDPLLYERIPQLKLFLRSRLGAHFKFGVRTNGALIPSRQSDWNCFDKASISLPSLNSAIYKSMMGSGEPPDLDRILAISQGKAIKINIVLGPENVKSRDLMATLLELARIGIKTVNLREPYGQPHIGDPLAMWGHEPFGYLYGMPRYDFAGMQVVYWDVHYVEVESVNLYANGVVSINYPITKGHDPKRGAVLDQSNFVTSGRRQEQWLGQPA